ncbi:STAS domain-containing protein [Desulfovibrio sp. JC022]|uniref:STAS domain-containing protein n=1 Tax=Desulfovibrio sp. JC022 TaxID=2593642 RepID=UPI0013D03C03|nr:STAS domain-containing protein [Desulfovibrio sp. JC022]NDV22049.1 PAS domain-containing protein [Desulfovibrio sp. JC022]
MSGADFAVSILGQVPTPVMAVNNDYELIYLNETGLKLLGKGWEEVKGQKCYDLFNSAHCKSDECRVKQAIAKQTTCTARNEVRIGQRTIPIEYTAAPLRDDEGNIIGGLEYIVDITRQVRDERKLQEQSKTILEISTPAISLWEGIIVLPLVGVVDSFRAQQMMQAMLSKIKETASKIIILDIQGVAAVDTAVANHLIKITKATKLMGCKCLISGISPAVAETIVQLGIDLGDIETSSTLKDALADAFEQLHFDVSTAK